MEENKIIESLSPIERKVLPVLSSSAKLNEIIKKTGIDKSSVLRALDFLENKKLVELKQEQKKIVRAGVNGLFYLKKQLPERRLLNLLSKKRAVFFHEIKEKTKLNENEIKISIGVLKRKALIKVSQGRIILIAKKEEITKKMLEEKFLEKLPIDVKKLEQQDKLALQNLKSRKEIIEIIDDKNVQVKLTQQGEKISKMNLDENMIEQLTPKIIKTEKWKGKKFRRYDLQSQSPKIYGGKKHFVNQAVEHAKKIWLEMGFKEMIGNLVQTSFWNFDALFTAQDLPEFKKGEKNIVEEVKKIHQGGEEIEGGISKGWEQEWGEEKAKKVLLRTHTTTLSIQTLEKISKKLPQNVPAKYFALGKCFRNETVDWSHGFEFNQTEGIVVDENANFRQLLGYLIEFFKKMGYEKIRIRPGYFPYTEPSLEIDVFHHIHKKWVELGGAGMFRPEVTVPIFGKHIPVLAWGPGFDRIIMEYFNITDLRQMYKNNLTKLREMKFWLK